MRTCPGCSPRTSGRCTRRWTGWYVEPGLASARVPSAPKQAHVCASFRQQDGASTRPLLSVYFGGGTPSLAPVRAPWHGAA